MSRCCKTLKLITKKWCKWLSVIQITWNAWCTVVNSKCSGFNNLQTYLEGKFFPFEFDDDYWQWDSTDRTELRNYTSSVEEFIELLVHQVDSLTTHPYITKSQSRYLKAFKTDIDQTECLILLDFAKNCHCVVQDEVQGYHWKKHATVYLISSSSVS